MHMLHMQVDMMEELGLEVKVIDSRWGEGANEEKLAQALKVRVAACTPFVTIKFCMVI
jgi:aspartate aminotransferase-like enzyme